MNRPDAAQSANVRSDSYLIAKASAHCGLCGQSTPVVAVLLPPAHETLSDGDDASELQWERASMRAFIFYVEHLLDPVRRRLQEIAPDYRPTLTPVTDGAYWGNHCHHCGSLQEDHDLFCEPDGAFLPTDSQAAAALEWYAVREPLQALAGGYAPDPELIEPPVAG